MSYVVLASLWSLYLALHSLLASNMVKHWFEKKLKLHGTSYRLLYSVFSTAGLVGIVWVMFELPERSLFDPTVTRFIGAVILLLGIWIIALSFKFFSGLEFVGLQEAEKEDQLITKGIHRKVRHPIYSGTILCLTGYFLVSPTDLLLVSILVIFIYLPIGIYFEEKKLILKFGDDYVDYRRKVPAIFPKLN